MRKDLRLKVKTANFKDSVENMKDLQSCMVLEGAVINVTNCSAFDIGSAVHHLSFYEPVKVCCISRTAQN